MKQVQILYFAVWAVPILLAALYWTGLLGSGGGIGADTTTGYLLYAAAIALTLIVVYAALKCFRFSWIRRMLSDKPQARRKYLAWNVVRLLGLLVVILLNLTVYFFMQADAGLYAAGVCLIALAFCWPNESELAYLQSESNT